MANTVTITAENPLNMTTQESIAGGREDPTILPAAAFSLFPYLPTEIRYAIWEFAAASPTPLIPDYTRSSDETSGPGNLVEVTVRGLPRGMADVAVYTTWSPLMHTCFASRHAALRSPALPLRFSAAAGFNVPYRPFDPAVDILFVSSPDRARLNIFHSHPESGAGLTSVRRLALRYEKSAVPPAWLIRGEPAGPDLPTFQDFMVPRRIDGLDSQGHFGIRRLVQLLKWPEERADFHSKSTADVKRRGIEAHNHMWYTASELREKILPREMEVEIIAALHSTTGS